MGSAMKDELDGIELRLSAAAGEHAQKCAGLFRDHSRRAAGSNSAPKPFFTDVMVAIAAIYLLVGGIGIMNIVLATVLERTREIGIRRSIGARRKDSVPRLA